MRVAAIDIGTNTILMLVAERRGGTLVKIADHASIVRLGEGVDKTRALKPEAIARARACLEGYAGEARALGVTRAAAVGTSAMRDAKGGEEVRAIVRDLFGVEARVISGDEEARLTFRGGVSGLALQSANVGVFDIGGGSTEIVIGEGGVIRFAQSFDIGSVRLTERHVASDPPSERELDAVVRDARGALAPARALEHTGELVGIAGTVTTLAAVDLELDPYDGERVHGHTMTRARLEELARRLAKLPLATRRTTRGLEPKRADVIVQGALIALAVMDALGKDRFRVSDRGVRWGLAEEILV